MGTGLRLSLARSPTALSDAVLLLEQTLTRATAEQNLSTVALEFLDALVPDVYPHTFDGEHCLRPIPVSSHLPGPSHLRVSTVQTSPGIPT